MTDFAQRVIDWQRHYGRHELPWQQQRSRYRVWVSEIMLQQTQVATAIPYFERFMQRFPNVQALANATQDQVLSHWAGLGYYARARNLHKAAQTVVDEFTGEMPSTVEALESLPGIGRSTAAAIVSLADNSRAAILDGNVKRVLARHAAIAGWPGKSQTLKQLWQQAEAYLPAENAQTYNQGLMDLGSIVCVRSKPLCNQCPVAQDCLARQQQRQQDYPSAKPTKKIPQKSASFLWLQNEHAQVWLIRRPPAGIWGGLWCLPQYDDLAALKMDISATALPKPVLEKLPPLQHVFSHFKLTIEPYRLCLEPEHTGIQKRLAIAEESGQFVPLNALAGYGLPAPIDKLIQRECSPKPIGVVE